ncbi:MAG: hypothetical protein RBG13Loki_2951 [Promethearchaeota archaeon CR_4]|nr:MAG: hypothetical protein RBG13Loki_2951 [Candidatus Lokiarchaeota archaeon CR_4]
MVFGILVLKAIEASKVEMLGVHPPEFICPPKLIDSIATNLDYGSFTPWGEVSTEEGVAFCKLEVTELGKEYLVCLASEKKVNLHSAAEFLNIIAPKLALAANLGKLAENLPKLASIVLENLQVSEIVAKKEESVPTKETSSPPIEVKICPFRMSLRKGQQECIREQCMAYFGDIGKAIVLLRHLFSRLPSGGNKMKVPFEELDQLLPKEGCFLIHGNPFRPAGSAIK